MTADRRFVRLERSRRPRSLQLCLRIRLAVRFRDLYAQHDRQIDVPSPPHGSWMRFVGRARLVRTQALDGVRSPPALADLQRRAQAAQSDLDAFVERLREHVRRPPPPTFRDLYAELVALEEEFEEVEIDLQARTLSVVTDRIELETVELGRFRIVMHCETPADPEYEVVALSPNEPSSSDFANVVHPHVRDDNLCEGDGHDAIRAALRSGRLCDYFALVRQVLRTYNPGSAYARLEAWHGVECADCGDRTSEDRISTCSCCDDSTCFDCGRCCSGCERDLCSSCTEACSVCRNPFCGSCLVETSPDGGGVCSDCYDEREREDENDDDEEGAPDAGEPVSNAALSSVHAVRVGEADVSA